MRAMTSIGPIAFALFLVVLLTIPLVHGQDQVILDKLDIDQQQLLQNGCALATDPSCGYPLKNVLTSGGHFWTTPFQPADGFGEGKTGPRASQREYFNPNADPKVGGYYPFLRLNGLDSQSCFECHNSIGSEPNDSSIDRRGTLMRKPFAAGGAAGSNSNAFINPYYPAPETLFIRNPPAVFGSGYVQAVAHEMTTDLSIIRFKARGEAAASEGTRITKDLVSKGISFGVFSTTYHSGRPASVTVDQATCPAGTGATPKDQADAAVNIGGEPGFDEDLTKIKGISCDLVVRPFQWKGVSAGLRHFVRDALDFHFSMQAFEKVGLCDCDRDGKGKKLKPEKPGDDRPEVTIGEVTAMAAFVAMMRPPAQDELSDSAKRGEKIFRNELKPHKTSLPPDAITMCATCHTPSLPLQKQLVIIEWPINPVSNASPILIDPDNSTTWPVKPEECKNGENPVNHPVASCPTEALTLDQMTDSAMFPKNPGTLISPLGSSRSLAVVERIARNLNAQKLRAPGYEKMLSANIFQAEQELNAPPPAIGPRGLGKAYTIPLDVPDSAVTALQLPRLPGHGSIGIPLFSDLKRHNMGKCLSDPVSYTDAKKTTHKLIPQGTDVMNIFNDPQEYLTRPLWGVADTGPWLHDGRALTLTDAILMHGDSATCGDSEARFVVDGFKELQPQEKEDLVNFLLTLRLPLPKGAIGLSNVATQ